jgi:hypothetical protein
MNPGVVHSGKDVFGADSIDFRPEEWKAINCKLLIFGASIRVCLENNASLIYHQHLD